MVNSCKPKPALAQRPLLSEHEVSALGVLFDSLANATRLRILYLLSVYGEMASGEMAERLGKSAQSVSNQLQKLADRGLVGARRQGSHMIYKISDPCVTAILERGLCAIEETQWSTQKRTKVAS